MAGQTKREREGKSLREIKTKKRKLEIIDQF